MLTVESLVTVVMVEHVVVTTVEVVNEHYILELILF